MGKKINKRKKAEFKMPKWQDCGWRRKACGKDNCPICGRIKKDRQKHVAKGEDPDTIEAVIKDVGKIFEETLKMLKADAKRLGIDLNKIKDEKIEASPKPEEFPLYREVGSWRQDVYNLADSCDLTNSAWFYSEAGKDLLWYANTLAAKTYRQLSNRWEMDHNIDAGEETDYQYTGRVLKECLKILNSALIELSKMDTEFRNKFKMAQLCLNLLAKKIEKI